MEQEEHQNDFPCMYEEHLKGERKEINKLIQYASALKSWEKRGKIKKWEHWKSIEAEREKRKERGKKNEERKDIHMYSRYKRRD